MASSSVANHLYFHYLRYDNTPSSYAPWDIWAWQYKPTAGEGYKFDWKGRTTSSDKLSATGDATTDLFGGAYVDIDLMSTYDVGWNSSSTVIGGKSVSYATTGAVCSKIGFQIVKSSTRKGSGFWTNDGSNIYVEISKYSFDNSDGSKSYHIFAHQDDVQNYKSLSEASDGVPTEDPFATDDGTKVTFGQSKYNDVDWTDKSIMATSPAFLKGSDGGAAKTSLKNGAGVGYQIMVASLADSDGDGFGDIYGIDQKLDYLQDLGVNVLWLTPIQLSDSYHGYDVSDYTQVDPKFGSKTSPAGTSASGSVTSATAMEDYKLLLKDAHEKGMAVIMDLVVNHTSTSNEWFINSAKLNDTYRGYYQWGNHVTDKKDISEEKYWYPYGDHVYSYYAKFGSSMPELNYAYSSTRVAVTSMAKNWCSLGVDGFRMDAVKHIFLNDETNPSATDTIISDVSTAGDYSSNLTKNLNFWKEFAYDVKTDYPNCFLVGENFDGTAYKVSPFYEGFDSMFDFYSYFNITSSARYALDGSVGGSIQAYDGLYNGGAFNSADGIKNPGTSLKYSSNSKWDLASVMNVNNMYRTGGTAVGASGYSFINGAFTSNHDIARPLNRIAGTGDNDGINAQGTITASNYDKYLQSATCAEIVELMLPGCTWIYYGDELGMTGNFLNGATSATDSYADLAYRQPMKWTDNAVVGDGSGFCAYNITGSGTGVKYDEVNSSSKVASVAKKDTSDHFKAIQAFAKAKSASPALIRGTYKAYGWDVNTPVNYVFNAVRTLGDESYNVVVNLSPTVTLGAGFQNDTLVASYNGGTLTSLPPLSAILVKH